MITDEELANLPEDPELAFVEFERIVRASLYEGEERAARESFDTDSIRLEYISKVIAAARIYELSAIADAKVPTVQSNISNAYVQFISDVDHVTTQIRIRHAPRNRQNTVALDTTTKTKVHHFIQQIRSIIEKADLPENKRDALYKKLSTFALEVDKNRTSLQAGMAIYISVCDGIGQGFQRLEPARKMIDSIAGLLGRAKDVEESSRQFLSPPVDRKQIEGPRPNLSLPQEDANDLDDEIPF